MGRMSGIIPACLVHLLYLAHKVGLLEPNKQDQPIKRDRPDRPNRPNEQDRLACFFSILLQIPAAFNRLEQRHIVGIFDIHPDRNAISDT